MGWALKGEQSHMEVGVPKLNVRAWRPLGQTFVTRTKRVLRAGPPLTKEHLFAN